MNVLNGPPAVRMSAPAEGGSPYLAGNSFVGTYVTLQDAFGRGSFGLLIGLKVDIEVPDEYSEDAVHRRFAWALVAGILCPSYWICKSAEFDTEVVLSINGQDVAEATYAELEEFFAPWSTTQAGREKAVGWLLSRARLEAD